MKFYKSKSILIIGAAGGIGSEIALNLAKFHPRLILMGRKKEPLEQLSKKIKNSYYYQIDITNLESIECTIESIIKDLGQIDIAINLAGYDVFKPFNQISASDIITTSRVNFEGPLLFINTILKHMLLRNKGIIVQINGFMGGRLAMPMFQIDAASRSGIATFCKALRKEIKKTGIRIVLFSPAGTNTEAERKRSAAWNNVKMRLDNPDYVAKRFLYELSRGTDNITFGTIMEKVFSRIELIFPKLADFLYYNSFLKNLKSF